MITEVIRPAEIQGVPTGENRGTFATRLNLILTPDQFQFSMAIYDQVKDAHKGRWRYGLEREFEHPRRAALIVLDELGVIDPDLINATLLHDTGEDTHLLGPFDKGMTNSQWRETANWRLIHQFGGTRVAEIVLTVTKPYVDGIEVKTKEKQEEMAQEQLRSGSFEALFVKMADRLDNLRTLEARTRENQERKMQETEEQYFPIFERGLTGPYARETGILLEKMKSQINSNRERLEQMGPPETISELSPFEKIAFTELIAGIPSETTRKVYRYDTQLIEQAREDIAARLGAKNSLDAVKLLFETGLLTYDDVDVKFNPFAYQTFTGRQRQFIDTLINPDNFSFSLEEIARHLKKRSAKELRREQDSMFGRLRIKNTYQLLAIVHHVRQTDSPQIPVSEPKLI